MFHQGRPSRGSRAMWWCSSSTATFLHNGDYLSCHRMGCSIHAPLPLRSHSAGGGAGEGLFHRGPLSPRYSSKHCSGRPLLHGKILRRPV